MTLFTVAEVASFLKLSVLTIYKYIKEQKLEAIQFGGHYRVSSEVLDRFIKDHTVSASPKLANDHDLEQINELNI